MGNSGCTLFGDTLGHFCGTLLRVVRHSCRTLLPSISLSFFLSRPSHPLSSHHQTLYHTPTHTHTHTHAQTHTHTMSPHTHTSQHNRLMYLLSSLLIFISLLLRFPCDVQTKLKFVMTCDPDSWFQYCRFLEKKYCREPANNPHQFRIVPKN